MLRATRLLAPRAATARAAAARTSRAATTTTRAATKRISAESARWRRTLHHMARAPMLPACALATITIARPPANCEGAVALPRQKTLPQKNWRVAKTLGGWSLRVFPVALWAPFALLIPFLRKWWWRHVLFAIEGCGPTSSPRPGARPVSAESSFSKARRGDRVDGVEVEATRRVDETQVPTNRSPAEPRDARDSDAARGPADARRRVPRR